MLRPIAAALLTIAFTFSAQAQTPQGTQAGFADLVEKLSPAVVNVSTTQKVKSGGVPMLGVPGIQGLPNTPEFEPFRDMFERFSQQQGGKPVEREVMSLGSGVIIDPTGYIVTNNHVIEEAEEITVTLANNDKYKAKIIGRDKKVDLALLKVEAKKPLPSVAFGDSDGMRVGDWVIAIGNPYGLGGTVTQGIISARQRSINAGPFDDFLQTDAPINRGNSGGPLFNLQGEVIGINTAIFSPSGGGSVGIGFAIPSELAKPVVAQLKEFGRTHRGWLGVKIQEVTEEMANSIGLAKPMGAMVLEVSPNGPAAKAGLMEGDVITELNGKEISKMRFLPRMVADTKIGSKAELTYFRKGKSQTAQVVIGELDEADSDDDASKTKKDAAPDKNSSASETFMGMQLSPLTDALKTELRLAKDASGVVIVSLANDSPGLRRGLRRGDVISDVNGEKVLKAADVKKQFAAAKAAGRNFAMVKVIRANELAFITLPVGESQ